MTSEPVWDAIRTRRAIRRFADRPLEAAHLARILDAGRRAGSSKNLQRWSFIVCRDRDHLGQLAAVGPWAGHLAGAAVGIALVTPDPAAADAPLSVMFDLGQAAGNMMLAAWELGIGSVPATVYDQVYNKLSLGFDCLGQQQMKNVASVTSYRVAMGGRAAGRDGFHDEERPAPQAGPVATSEAGAQRSRDRSEPSTLISSISDQLASLPRPIAAALTVSSFLILINLLTNPHKIWFHWPVAVLVFGSILRTVLRHSPASDRYEDRRSRRE